MVKVEDLVSLVVRSATPRRPVPFR